jgi:hypothetical protein
VTSQICSVTEKKVAHRACLDADILFLHCILKVGVQKELETMAKTFGAEGNRVK